MLASLPSPSTNVVHLGPLTLHVYGLLYVVALVVAVWITRRRWVAAGGDPELPAEVALWAFPAGLVGGRIYFLATSWNQVPHHWWGPLAVWRGGLGIWGGVAAGTLAGVLFLRRRGIALGPFMDAAAPALLVAQAVGRIGNYFNQELFGKPTSLPWGLSIDPTHRPTGYGAYSTFHPIFLYELIFDLLFAAALVALGRTGRIRPPGLFALYVAGYSGFRIFEELLRVDPAHHLFGLRLNFFVAVVLTAAGLAWFVYLQRGRDQDRGDGHGNEGPPSTVAAREPTAGYDPLVCWQCMQGAMTAVAGASGVRSWLGTRRFSWLTPRRLRMITIALVAGALIAPSVLMSGATAPAQGGHPAQHQAVSGR